MYQIIMIIIIVVKGSPTIIIKEDFPILFQVQTIVWMRSESDYTLGGGVGLDIQWL